MVFYSDSLYRDYFGGVCASVFFLIVVFLIYNYYDVIGIWMFLWGNGKNGYFIDYSYVIF